MCSSLMMTYLRPARSVAPYPPWLGIGPASMSLSGSTALSTGLISCGLRSVTMSKVPAGTRRCSRRYLYRLSTRLIVDSLTPYISVSSRQVVPLANRRRASAFWSSLRTARFALVLRSNPVRRSVSQTVFRRTLYRLASSYVNAPAS